MSERTFRLTLLALVCLVALLINNGVI